MAKKETEKVEEVQETTPITGIDEKLAEYEKRLEGMEAMAAARADKIVADAEAKATAILADVENKINAPKEEDPDEEAKRAYNEEKVKIKLFRDNDKYKDALFVCVNGSGMYIPRGKMVEIPRKYLNAIQDSEFQQEFADSYMDEQSNIYRKSEEFLS